MSLSANWFYRLRGAARRPWLRVALFSIGGVVAALASARLAPLIPPDLAGSIGSDAVDQILTVLASGMLPVATFSLSTMVQAYGAATSNVTPRAVTLLMRDTRAQTAVSSFVGAFVYSVVGLIALKTDVYGAQGRVILFGLTLAVLALVVATLVRWIDTLSHLGRVGETVDVIEAAASEAVRRRAEAPYLGGLPWTPPPEGAPVLRAVQTGYVAHIDAGALDALAEERGLTLHLSVLPGSFVHPGRPLVAIDGSTDEKARAALAKAFVVEDRRSFDEDPRFGIIVLSEVASRALSPAVNDPGTAIDVIGTLVRVLALWAECRAEAPEARKYPRLRVHGITARELFDDGFTPIARDGAAIVEVGIRLQKALAALHALGGPAFREAAREQAALALDRARAAMSVRQDVAAVEAAHRALAHRDGDG